MTAAVAAGAVSLAGTASALGALVFLHVAPTGVSAVRDAVSQYGISTYKAGYRVLTISMGVAAAALGVGLHDAVHGSGIGLVVGLVGAFAACRLAISWVPMDAPGAPRTSTGSAHGLLAIVTFAAAAAAAIRLCRVLEGGTVWRSLAEPSRAMGWAMVACFALMAAARISPELRRGFGAAERALYALILSWLAVFALACVAGHP